jgi:hypothetical protein
VRPAARPAAWTPTASAGSADAFGPVAAPPQNRVRTPAVRLAPREELAAAARVAPLLRTACELARWAAVHAPGLSEDLPRDLAATAADQLDTDLAEVEVGWQIARAAGLAAPASDSTRGRIGSPPSPVPADVLGSGSPEAVLAVWERALGEALRRDDLDGLATALYTVGGPVRMEALFDAYGAAAGATRRSRQAGRGGNPEPDQTAELSSALELLADLGAVELGTEDEAGGLTVALSPVGVWGVHRRLRAEGWHVPVLGAAARDSATELLLTLAACDAEDGETEISAWLAARPPAQAAADLIRAASSGSPGLRGAAFAVLDRVGTAAIPEVRAALADPMLRAHAAVWLHEHGEDAELRPEDRAWLLVDLGSGLLEEADPRDVARELLPDVPTDAQAELVSGLWQVAHPGVPQLLTALSKHHPDPTVARAARKAAFKASSPVSGYGANGP